MSSFAFDRTILVRLKSFIAKYYAIPKFISVNHKGLDSTVTIRTAITILKKWYPCGTTVITSTGNLHAKPSVALHVLRGQLDKALHSLDTFVLTRGKFHGSQRTYSNKTLPSTHRKTSIRCNKQNLSVG